MRDFRKTCSWKCMRNEIMIKKNEVTYDLYLELVICKTTLAKIRHFAADPNMELSPSVA